MSDKTTRLTPFTGDDPESPQPEAALTVSPALMAASGFEGEILPEEIRIPTLNIVQGVGDLADSFRSGAVVLNKETLLSDGGTPLGLTLLRCRKFYVENLPYGSEQRPALFDKLQDVLHAGGTLEWLNDTPPTFQTVLQCQVLLERPEGAGGEFPYSYAGEDYAMALWTLRGMAFSRVGRSLLTFIAQLVNHGQPLYCARWMLTTTREKLKNKNTVAVPVLRNSGRNTPEFQGYAASLLQN